MSFLEKEKYIHISRWFKNVRNWLELVCKSLPAIKIPIFYASFNTFVVGLYLGYKLKVLLEGCAKKLQFAL